jgi:nucleotide-binding universal stress UspA family protein
LNHKVSIPSIEWSWNDSPIMLPLAFVSREWNAVHIAFFLAEYSGSLVNIMHVNSTEDDSSKKDAFLKKLGPMANELKVKYTVSYVDSRSAEPGVSEIADAIVSQSEKMGCQAIVMSANRESFFREFFGRISDKVARKSKRTVLLVETPHPNITIPTEPSKILIPILRDEYDSSPYIVAAALSSTATTPHSELVVARVVYLPPTIPLDAVEVSKSLRHLEQNFSYYVASSIRNLGRLFTPKILPVRDIGKDVNSYAQEIEADAIVLCNHKPSGFRRLLPREEYDIVGNATRIVLVVFPKEH